MDIGSHIQIKINQALRQDPWCTIKSTLNLTGRNSLAKFSASYLQLGNSPLPSTLATFPGPSCFMFFSLHSNGGRRAVKKGEGLVTLITWIMSGGGEVDVGGRVHIQITYSTLAPSALFFITLPLLRIILNINRRTKKQEAWERGNVHLTSFQRSVPELCVTLSLPWVILNTNLEQDYIAIPHKREIF